MQISMNIVNGPKRNN